jgi:ribosomal protein S18 acetylase RimI-like enzyme
VIEPGDDTHVEAAWQLKEEIRKRQGVLKQRRGFFENAYRRSTVYIYEDETTSELIGFAAVRRDGYILFLAVHPDYRGEGFGKALVARVAEENGSVTCHARTTNSEAMQFYQHIGFEVRRKIAYYLQLGESEGLTERLSKLLWR